MRNLVIQIVNLLVMYSLSWQLLSLVSITRRIEGCVSVTASSPWLGKCRHIVTKYDAPDWCGCHKFRQWNSATIFPLGLKPCLLFHYYDIFVKMIHALFLSCLLIFAPLTLLHKPFSADFWTSWVLECNDRDLQWLGLSSQFATVITVFCSHLLIWYTYKLRTLPANFWWQRRPNTESTFIWNSVVIWVSLEYVLVFWSSMHAYRRLLK